MQDQPVSSSHRSEVAQDILCAVSYLTMLPAVAMLLVPGTARNRRIRFHACQSVLINWLLLSAGFFLHMRAGIDQLTDVGSGSRFEWTARILCMAVWSMVSLSLARGHEVRIPLLAGLAERQAEGWAFRRLASARGEARATANPRLNEAIQLSN
jgi:uncharacterized membrane protein